MNSPVSEPSALQLGSQALEIVFGKSDEGALAGATRNERQAKVQYWRKPEYPGATDSGWIMPGPEISTDGPKFKQFMDKGRSPLPARFGMQITGQPDSTMSWEANHRQRANPLIWLEPFIKAGGLSYIIQPNDNFGPAGHYLMPDEQLVCYGIHRQAGIKDIRPGLAEAVDVECPHGCISEGTKKRQVFSGINREEANKSLDQHLVAKHRESEGQRAMGKELKGALSDAGVATTSSGLSSEDIAKIAAIVAATIQGMQAPASQAIPFQGGNWTGGFVGGTTTDPGWNPNSTVTLTTATTPVAQTFNLSSATRQEMMAYSKANGIPFPENGVAMKTEAWRDYLAQHLAA